MHYAVILMQTEMGKSDIDYFMWLLLDNSYVKMSRL